MGARSQAVGTGTAKRREKAPRKIPKSGEGRLLWQLWTPHVLDLLFGEARLAPGNSAASPALVSAPRASWRSHSTIG